MIDQTTFFDLSYGLFVLGTLDGQRPTGCTVNTCIQVTTEPNTLTICVGHDRFTNQCIKQTGRLAVSVLSQDVTMDTIGGFGFRSGRESDKFAQVPHTLTPGGLPVLTQGVCAWLECKVKTSIELSTHTLFVLEVVEAQRSGQGKVPPMTYAEYHRRKNAQPAVPAPATTGEVWVCTICGYEYDGAQGPFEALPADWKCPLCGAPKSLFEKKV